MSTEKHILLKSDSKISYSVTGGQCDAIQKNYLLRHHVSKICGSIIGHKLIFRPRNGTLLTDLL